MQQREKPFESSRAAVQRAENRFPPAAARSDTPFRPAPKALSSAKGHRDSHRPTPRTQQLRRDTVPPLHFQLRSARAPSAARATPDSEKFPPPSSVRSPQRQLRKKSLPHGFRKESIFKRCSIDGQKFFDSQPHAYRCGILFHQLRVEHRGVVGRNGHRNSVPKQFRQRMLL